jgi:uncharacterized ferritin-like protein (DUF455 family)/tRNA isopentenyl-2-thiomethyl-A-37 hydroxylase MiaE
MSHSALNYRRTTPGFMHDVQTNARRLGILYTVEVELARVLGRWIPATPELPEKLTLARLLFEDADHARLIEARLAELRVSDTELSAFRRRTAEGLREVEQADDPHTVMAALARVVKPRLLADYRRHLDAAPPYVDDPTVRMLKAVVAEEADHIAALQALLAERRVDVAEHARFLAAVEAALWDLTADDGALVPGFVGDDPIAQPRPNWPAAVQHVGYRDPMPPYPDDFDGAMRRVIHDLVFSEVEALDIFGRYVYEFSDMPWAFSHEAARISWDEARHVELLLNVLARYGGSIGDFPAKCPGYEEFVRGQTTLEKLIMVNVIAEGEVSTDTQTQHRDAFRELGDELSAILKDYEMADEVVHGRFGVKWAAWLVEHTGTDYDAAYARAKAALEEFKSMHDEDAGESPIPLLRLGADETGPRRQVNLEAKRLVGFTAEDIARITGASERHEPR